MKTSRNSSSPRQPPQRPARVLTAARWTSTLAMFGIALVLALIVYGPALHGSFIWDDDAHVTRADLRSLDGLSRIWFEPGATQQYYPLLHSAFWLEHKLWGDAPLGYHLVNVLLHAVAATLFGTILRRLAVPGAWLGAALFLLHPVCVESVAWISEQKNTLSLVLYLGAALAYLRFTDHRTFGNYLFAAGLFVLALLTKTVTATLPAALLVIGWWQHGRLEWRRDILPLLPWFALGAVGGLLTAHFERVLIGAEGADFALGWLDRVVLAGRVVGFYLSKLLWPANLIFFYPRWTINAAIWWQWLFPVAALASLGGLALWQRRRTRGPLAVALLFGGSLFPVLGFFNVYPFLFSYVADHFQYLASLAIFAFAGASLSRLPRPVCVATSLSLSLVLGVLSWRQSRMYRDVFTLYETTLRQNPACWIAHTNLAIALVEANRAREALPHCEAALRLRPDYARGEHNYGKALNHLGRHAEALPHLDRAIALKPGFASAHNEMGAALMATGRTVDALPHFETAVRLSPDFGLAHRNLGLALAMSERVTESLPYFTKAARLLPDDIDVRLELSLALANERRYDEAMAELKTVLAMNPRVARAHYQLALILHQLGRIPESDVHYREAIRLDPNVAR